jgi:hypothetical protein
MEKNGQVGSNTPKCCGGSCRSKAAGVAQPLTEREIRQLDEDVTKVAARAAKDAFSGVEDHG